jgi:hypothetical protein
MYYVGLKDESFNVSVYRYKRSSILLPSSTRTAAHNAAQFLFNAGSRYNLLDLQGRVLGASTVNWSYWNDGLRKNIPNWLDLDAYERKYLNVSKDHSPYSTRSKA